MSDLPILSVSWTQMTTWNDCKYKWWLKYNKRITPVHVSDGMSKGRIVHELMQGLFDFQYKFQEKKKRPPSVDESMNYFQKALGKLQPDPTDVQNIMVAAYVITRFIKEYQPQEEAQYRTIAAELELRAKLETERGRIFELVGIIDRIMHNLRNGKNYLGETKTHGARPWKPEKIEMDGQQLVYIELARAMGWELEDILYLFINTWDYKTKETYGYEKFFQKELVIDRAQLRNGFLRELHDFVDEVYDFAERGLRPRRSIGPHCGDCYFQSYCFGRLRGLRHSAALGRKYVVKEDKPSTEESEDV